MEAADFFLDISQFSAFRSKIRLPNDSIFAGYLSVLYENLVKRERDFKLRLRINKENKESGGKIEGGVNVGKNDRSENKDNSESEIDNGRMNFENRT